MAETVRPKKGNREAFAAVRQSLQGDCDHCFGLCCAALPFAASADFAIDKAAGQPCLHLRGDFRCGIHDSLRQKGFRGCTVYDCFGAGQKVSRVIFNGVDWRQNPGSAASMFETFLIVRQLHEMLAYVAEALTFPSIDGTPLQSKLLSAYDETEKLAGMSPEKLELLDVPAHRAAIGALLMEASELERKTTYLNCVHLRGADRIGASMRKADLRGACLRGAYLVAADLRGANLRGADALGADFRDADLSGADLTGCLFLTQMQLHAARGDSRTILPPSLRRPDHWPTV